MSEPRVSDADREPINLVREGESFRDAAMRVAGYEEGLAAAARATGSADARLREAVRDLLAGYRGPGVVELGAFFARRYWNGDPGVGGAWVGPSGFIALQEALWEATGNKQHLSAALAASPPAAAPPGAWFLCRKCGAEIPVALDAAGLRPPCSKCNGTGWQRLNVPDVTAYGACECGREPTPHVPGCAGPPCGCNGNPAAPPVRHTEPAADRIERAAYAIDAMVGAHHECAHNEQLTEDIRGYLTREFASHTEPDRATFEATFRECWAPTHQTPENREECWRRVGMMTRAAAPDVQPTPAHFCPSCDAGLPTSCTCPAAPPASDGGAA